MLTICILVQLKHFRFTPVILLTKETLLSHLSSRILSQTGNHASNPSTFLNNSLTLRYKFLSTSITGLAALPKVLRLL